MSSGKMKPPYTGGRGCTRPLRVNKTCNFTQWASIEILLRHAAQAIQASQADYLRFMNS